MLAMDIHYRYYSEQGKEGLVYLIHPAQMLLLVCLINPPLIPIYKWLIIIFFFTQTKVAK